VAWATLLGGAGSLAAAAVLWFGSGPLARLVWGGIADGTGSFASPVEFQRALFAALGIYLLALGLPELIAPIRAYLIRPEGFALEAETAWNRQVEAIGAVLHVIVGVWLLFGSRQLAVWLSRLREPRIETIDENS
jgi:hypothetical protein